MAGRGRGGKSGSSLTHEQLQALGYNSKEIPPVSTAPPPTFPPLMKKPIPAEITPVQNYKILWKEDFLNYMRDSPYYLTPKVQSTNIERYSDQYLDALENTKEKCKAEIPWDLMPNELRPKTKRKVDTPNLSVKRTKTIDVEEKLKKLEEKEKTGMDTEKTKDPSSDSEKEDEENPEVEEDDEMDEENDYGNNYFDNGESYNDDDDNLDDGPVY